MAFAQMGGYVKKARYRIRNWREYNEALVNRGQLTLWFDEEAVASWEEKERTGRRGAPRVYSDVAILCALTLRAVFRLPLRATEGLVRSVIVLMGLALPTPDYTTLCRRQGALEVVLPRRLPKGSVHVVVDATGLKVFGEGEWKVRQHGYSRRRTWRKLHLAVDETSHEVLAAAVTTNDVGDNEMLPDLLSAFDGPIGQVSADGVYDTWENYHHIEQLGARAAIPPRRTARIRQHGNSRHPPLPRDEALRAIRRHGRSAWKRAEGYHRRSLAETAIFRIKTLFGGHLSARRFDHQATETFIRCRAMNRMTHLGMPDSYRIAEA
jgi:IS5 family transposase